ncbi:MAG: peptidase M48 [Chromatiales bacterium]|jgi:Zn-dependent protease with chaperone function|nr:peptidase M48 [Chromatiales bacterium]MDP6151506.1 M48 family metallopeptidase [Gammaproteobacteria bacterium]MDP7271217.1 M48 family metallopeptidase [Gammaproteobacteria bacterium]HJP04539.1 M48 family metallopeptidase [Gammaproteobacteria bacterium]
MNFFAAQEDSHRNSRKLILLMTLAVAAIAVTVTVVVAVAIWSAAGNIEFPDPLVWAANNSGIVALTFFGTIAFIGIASIYRVSSLRQGGGRVARDLGGTQLLPGDSDPLHRRLRNVVEEMAIASGIPVPEIYVLYHEDGINAFAAGFGTDDAAVAVTRGTLEHLNREELQGVIAHEFSHILNGDMRLNIRLMGPLFGILAIGLLGRILLRGRRGGSTRRGRGGGAPIMVLGIGLMVTGYVGLFAARLIKAGVSRQREYLADASAVQFTRQTDGITGALKKIGGLATQSTLKDGEAEEVSHMLFANGLGALSSMLATHPPLLKRIQALDPAFTAEAFGELQTEVAASDAGSDAPASGFASGPGPAIHTDPDSLMQSIGNPDERHIELAHGIRARIPETINEALDSADQVVLLLPALMLNYDPTTRGRQLDLLSRQLGDERRDRVAQLYAERAGLPNGTRLPLVELALPLIKVLPQNRREYLLELLTQLALIDNHMDTYEYALLRLVGSYLRRAAHPAASRRWRRLSDPRIRDAARTLLSIYARRGHRDETLTVAAYRAGAAILGTDTGLPDAPADWVRAADEALDRLLDCVPKDRQTIIAALLASALLDDQISRAESELLRAICALLECPMPPVVDAA